MTKKYIGLHVKYPLYLQDFNETWISRQIFDKKILNIKFHENPSIWRRIGSMRTYERTDRHDEANSRFSQFCERSKELLIFKFWLSSYKMFNTSANSILDNTF
jgi:hypothetical protein